MEPSLINTVFSSVSSVGVFFSVFSVGNPDPDILKTLYNVSTLVFGGMIFAMRSGREKIILSDLKNPPDRLKKHVPGNTQFLCHKKPKLKQYTRKFMEPYLSISAFKT